MKSPATGQEGAPHVPDFEGAASFGGEMMHASAWQGAEAQRGKRALVVGFGNSGSEIAMDLWEHGANVTVAVRSPINVVPRWLMELYPHGNGLLRAIERWYMPPWISDIIGHLIVNPLLYRDLPSLGLQLSSRGVKTSLINLHRAPLMDIGTIDLIRKRQVAVESRHLARFTAGGATFCDADGVCDAQKFAAGDRDLLMISARITYDGGRFSLALKLATRLGEVT